MESSKILVDTDILINFLRKKPQAKLLLKEGTRAADLYLSVITVAELLAGMRPAEEEETESLISGFTLLPVSESVARLGGELRRKASKNVLLPDCLIAATALKEECLILTGNLKDYPFQGIQFFTKEVV